MNELDSALHALDPDVDHDLWFRILAAYKIGGGLKETAEDWSAGGQSFSRSDFNDTWRYIRPGHVTERTIYFLAKEKKWKPSHADPSAPKPVPIRAPALTQSPTRKTARAIWQRSTDADVESHPYALKKKITHAFERNGESSPGRWSARRWIVWSSPTGTGPAT